MIKSIALLAGVASATLFAGCGGGGSGQSAVPIAQATAVATAAATTAPAARTVKAAPLSSSPTVSQSSGRNIQDINSIPKVLVESSGTAGLWGGNFVVWVTDANGADVVEASATTVATNNLQIDNPPIKALPCSGLQAQTSWCVAHPSAWEFGTNSGLVKPIGAQTITVTFGDGSSAPFTDYVYNGWQLACGQSMAYQSGTPAVVATGADVTNDCTGGQITFPHGVVIAAGPKADAFGRMETNVPSVTSAVVVPNGSPTSIAFSSIAIGTVYVFATTDGGFAKFYPTSVGGTLLGLSLHSSANGSYAF